MSERICFVSRTYTFDALVAQFKKAGMNAKIEEHDANFSQCWSQ